MPPSSRHGCREDSKTRHQTARSALAGTVLNRELPAIPVRIVKPQAQMRRARRCRADLVTRVFQFYAVFLQRLERFAQRAHTVEMKRHVVDRVRMWCAFEEPDDHGVVRQRDGLIGPEHFLQIEVLGPKLRVLLRVSDSKTEMPNRAKLYFHIRTS